MVRGAQKHAAVCVVDDCSSDGTPAILGGIPGLHVIRHSRNTHIAGAVLDGMRYALEAGYDYVVTMDAGRSHDPDELPRFLEAPASDLLLGNRNAGGEFGKPLYRRTLSATGTLLMNAILRDRRADRPRWIRDCTNSYRRYSRRSLEILTRAPLQSRSFDFLLESLAVLSRSGLSIDEVPITYRFSNSSLDWRAVRECLRTWWRLRRG